MSQEQLIEPSKEEFEEWKNCHVGKFVFGIIEDQKNMTAEFLENGGTCGVNAEITTDRVVGRLEGFKFLLNIQYEEKKSYGH